MKKTLKYVIIPLTLLSLAACGIFHNRANDYVHATTNPNLTVPKNVTAIQIKKAADQPFPVPAATKTDSNLQPNLTPPGLETRLAAVEAPKKSKTPNKSDK